MILWSVGLRKASCHAGIKKNHVPPGSCDWLDRAKLRAMLVSINNCHHCDLVIGTLVSYVFNCVCPRDACEFVERSWSSMSSPLAHAARATPRDQDLRRFKVPWWSWSGARFLSGGRFFDWFFRISRSVILRRDLLSASRLYTLHQNFRYGMLKESAQKDHNLRVSVKEARSLHICL